MRTVNDIIKSKKKPQNFIAPAALVIEALQLMTSVNLSYLVVMDGDDFKGVFSERDYTRNLALKGRSSKETEVQEVMATDLPVVPLTGSVEECMRLMNERSARYLLAFDGKDFAGVITIHDLLRQVIANKELVFDETLANSLLDNDESGRVY